MEKRRVWEVGEGWAGGDVQGESMPGFLTMTCASTKLFQSLSDSSGLPPYNALGFIVPDRGTRGNAARRALKALGVCVGGGSPNPLSRTHRITES